jgi:signal transduction histidine kinase
VRTSEITRPAHEDPEGVPQRYVCTEVIDQGTGIATPLLTKIFDPFFSTKSAEGGTGLGLSVAQGIALEHEGWIAATSTVGQGACFQVYLPQRRSQSEEISDASQAAVH